MKTHLIGKHRKSFVLMEVGDIGLLPADLPRLIARISPFAGLEQEQEITAWGNLLEDLSEHETLTVKSAVARNPGTPPRVLEKLARDSILAEKVAINPASPEWLLSLLAKSKAEKVLEGIASNPSTPTEVLEELSKLDPGTHLDILKQIASNPSTPSEVLNNSLIFNDDLLLFSLRNPSAPEEMLRAWGMGEKQHYLVTAFKDSLFLSDIHETIAENPSTPVDVLEHLATIPDGSVLCALSRNPSTPVHILSQLSLGRVKLKEIILNPSLPFDVFNRLKTSVPFELAGSPATPPSILVWVEELASKFQYMPESSPYLKYREALAANVSSPPELLERLSKDQAFFVAGNPSAPAYLLRGIYTRWSSEIDPDGFEAWLDENKFLIGNTIPAQLAKNPSTPIDVIHAIHERGDEELNATIAKNPSTPFPILEKLATEKSIDIVSGVAENLRWHHGSG